MNRTMILKISMVFFSVLLVCVLAIWASNSTFHWCFGGRYWQIHFESPGRNIYCEYISEPLGLTCPQFLYHSL